MTDDGTAKVHVGRTPIATRDDSDPVDMWDYDLWRPSTIIRKENSSGALENLFVSVIEPMKDGVSSIVKVERLPVTGR